jgi:DnaD/phage-associated family protein
VCSDTAPFEGFRAGQRATTIPVQFFTEVLPSIADPQELRVTLYALYALQRPGHLPALRASELAGDAPLVRSLDLLATRRAVEAAVARGVLLSLPLEDGDALLFVNNDGGRRLRDRIASGAEAVPGGARVASVGSAAPSRPAAVYEQEIGLLTASVGAALAEAEQKYPAAWIIEALQMAARQNARSWAYAEAILRRWEAEGRNDEATEGHPGRRANPYDAVVRRGYD